MRWPWSLPPFPVRPPPLLAPVEELTELDAWELDQYLAETKELVEEWFAASERDLAEWSAACDAQIRRWQRRSILMSAICATIAIGSLVVSLRGRHPILALVNAGCFCLQIAMIRRTVNLLYGSDTKVRAVRATVRS